MSELDVGHMNCMFEVTLSPPPFHFTPPPLSIFPPCLIHRIDANVSETQSNVEAAHTELLKYFKSVTSNRWLMVKIFLVVLVFFIIFIVFLT